jgi:PAS domain S-box-containing protein
MDKYLFLLLLFFFVGGTYLFLFHYRKIFGIGIFYACVGTFQFFQDFISFSLVVELYPGLEVQLGSLVFFSAALFTVLLVYLKEDASKARTLILAIISINLIVACIQFTIGNLIANNWVLNGHDIPLTFFHINFKTIIIGTILFFIDSIFIILLYNRIMKVVKNIYFSLFIAMFLVLLIDYTLFQVFGLGRNPFEGKLLLASMISPLISTTLYTIIFGSYLTYIDLNRTLVGEGTSFYKVFSFLSFQSKVDQISAKYKIQNSEIIRELEKTESKYGIAAGMAKLAYYEFNTETKKLVITEKAHEVLRTTPIQIPNNELSLGEYITLFNLTENSNTFIDKFNELKTINSSYERQFTYPLTFGDGTPGFLSTRIIVIKDISGNILKAHGVIQDVTDTETVRELAVGSEKRFKALSENSTEAVCVLNPTGSPIFFSKAVGEILGYSKTELDVIKMADIIYPEHAERLFEAFGKSISSPGETIAKPRCKWLHKKGHYIWLEGSFKNMMHEPLINGIIDNFQNIDNVVKFENELIRQSQLQKMLVGISTKYINLSTDEAHQAINTSLKELANFVEADRAYVFEYDFQLGFCSNTHEWCAEGVDSQKQILQYLSLTELHESWVNDHKKGHFVYVHDATAYSDIGPLMTAKGQQVKSVLLIPMMHEGQCQGFVGFDSIREHHKYANREITILSLFTDILVNIQNRIEKEKLVRWLLNKTENQNKRLRDFSFMTSHNIRSAVANLLGLVDILGEDLSENELIQLTKDCVVQLDRTLKNINKVTLMGDKVEVVLLKESYLSVAINEVIKDHQKLIKQKNAKVNLSVQDSFNIMGSIDHLTSIFENLILNSLRYGIDEEHKEVDIKIRKISDNVHITVTNNVCGVELEDSLDEIFALGSRMHDIISGDGIGLFVTKLIVEALKGSISVSIKENYINFSIILPVENE